MIMNKFLFVNRILPPSLKLWRIGGEGLFWFMCLLFACNLLGWQNLSSSRKQKKEQSTVIKKNELQIKYAVFDVNGSFWKPRTNEIFSKYMEKQKISFWDKIKLGGYWAAYKLGTINIKEAYGAFVNNFKGKTKNEINEQCRSVWNELCKNYIFKESVDLFKDYKKRGVKTIIASNALSNIYDNLLQHYKFDYVCASVVELKDGKATGKLEGLPCVSNDKKKIIQELIEKKLGGSLKEVVFYASSHLDKHLLNIVGKPIAFNPDPQLEVYARSKNWEIIKTSEFIKLD